MRIRFKKADLLSAASVVQSVANPQSTLPILSNVLITTEHENVVSLSATDFETRVRIEVAAEVEKKGSATVPARTFYDLVKELPDDSDVLVEVKDKSATIRCREIRCELACMPARDFPKWPDMDAKVAFDVAQKDMKSLLDKVLFAVPVRDPRKVLLGALFEVRKGVLTAVATDGKILACVKLPLTGEKVPKELNVVVPHKLLDELSRNLREEGVVNMAFDERQVSFRMENIQYLSNQVEGKYPNHEGVTPKEFSREFRFQRPPMLSAIRRASILSDIKQNSITLVFSGDQVSVEAECYDRGKIHEEMPAVVDGDDFRIVFNYKFVQEALKALDREEILLLANQSSLPAVLRAADVPENFYVVMPIKLQDLQQYEEPQDDEAPHGDSQYDDGGMGENP
jgi:DNA polymerase-3 subunit beta